MIACILPDRRCAACSLLKFDGSDKTYDLYRDEAGKLVMRDGGGLAFLGNVVVSAVAV